MSRLSPEEILYRIENSGIEPAYTTARCTKEEIEKLEKECHLKLPEVYKRFLLSFGKSTGSSFLGEAIFLYSGILEFQHLVDQEARNKIPSTAYVFLIHDVLILFFDTAIGDDPPIYRLMEHDSKPEKVFDSFTEWLNDYVLSEVESILDLRDKKSQQQ